MEFRLLGPIEAWDADGRLPLAGGARHRTVLAALLLAAGRPVPLEKLVDAVWGENPPATVRSQVQICVSGLRRQLRLAIHSSHGGYSVEVGPGSRLADRADVDANHFTDRVWEIQAAADRHGPEWSAKWLRAALDLWRGPALQGAPGLTTEATRLDELRLSAAERLFDAELECGRHDLVSGELQVQIRENPLRERFHAQLMLALYRSSRQVEALDVYRHVQQRFRDELGLEPSHELRNLERMILVNDEGLAPPRGQAPAVGRSTTPADTAGARHPRDGAFAGRRGELDRLRELLVPGDPRDRTRIVALWGMPGAGKSALAAEAAADARDRFPGGVLIVRGDSAASGDAAGGVADLRRRLEKAAPGWLRERNAGGADPADPAHRRLVVLDGLRGDEDLSSVVPLHSRSVVLVTCRTRPAPPVTAADLHVGPLDRDTAGEMLSGRAGVEAVAAEPRAVRVIIDACDGLAEAVQIAARRLGGDGGPARLAGELSDERTRLDALADAEGSVRALFDETYASLGSAEQHVLRRLGLARSPDLDDETLTTVLDVPAPVADDLLARLGHHGLLQRAGPGTGPLRMNGLLHLYAVERARSGRDRGPQR